MVRPSLLRVEGPKSAVATEPKAMQMLLVFADAAGSVLTRDDLMAACWRGRTVGDDSVNRVIAELRRVARDAGAGFEIENIPRTGYRLVELESSLPDLEQGREAAVAAPGKASAKASKAPVTRRWLLAGGVTALAAGGAAFWATRPPPPDSETERLLAAARVALRPGMPTSDKEAIALAGQAVARSPDHAGAWGLLALANARAVEHASSENAESAAAIDRAAGRALALEPDNADARAALALAIPYFGDWLSAERRFDAVLADHPDHVIVQGSRSFMISAVGRARESGEERVATAPKAPLDASTQYGLVYGLWFLGRIEEADRVAGRALEMWPRHYGAWFARLWVLAQTQRFDRALAQIDDEATRPALPPPLVGTLRAVMQASMTGDKASTEEATRRVMAGVSKNVAAVVAGMMALLQLNALDEAFALSDAYYLEQGPILAAMKWRPGQPALHDTRRRKTNMLFTPTAARMQQDPRFMPLMEKMGLVEYWEKRGIRPDFMRT